MRLWAGEKIVRVWVGDAIFRIDRGAVRVEETVTPVEGALDAGLDEVVAWSPSGQRLDRSLVTGGRTVLDAVALDDVRIAAVLANGRAAPHLVVGPPEGPFELDIALDASLVVGGPGRTVRMHASAHGIAVAGSSGHIAVVRPGASAVSFTLQVPTQFEATLDAVPTREGALVTQLVSGRYGTVLHFASDGARLGRWEGFGCFPALLLDLAGREGALAYDDERRAVVLLSLPRLEEVAFAETSSASILREAAARPQGGSVVLASSEDVLTATIKRTSLAIRGPYSLGRGSKSGVAAPASATRPPAAPKSKTLSEVSGPAAIGFPTEKQLEPPWQVDAGEDVVLPLRVRSVGGPGTGIAIALGGAPVDAGLLTGVSVRVDGMEAPLTREGAVLRGSLPDVALPAGLQNGLSATKAPSKDEQVWLAPTHLTVELLVRGVAKGAGLLTVSIAALEGTGIKRTRPITIT